MKLAVQILRRGLGFLLFASFVFIISGCGHPAIPSEVAPTWGVKWNMSPVEVEENMSQNGELVESRPDFRKYRILGGYSIMSCQNGEQAAFFFDHESKLHQVFLIMNSNDVSGRQVEDALKLQYGPVQKDSVSVTPARVAYPLSRTVGNTKLTLVEIPDWVAAGGWRCAMVMLSRQ